MTITAMAKQLNVSTMTIYRRCKKHGVKLDGLRDDLTGELTSEGVATIAAMFDATRPKQAITGDATQTAQTDINVTSQTPQGQPDATAAILQAKLDGAAALIAQLQDERDELRRQLAAAQAALAAEIQDRASERQLLTGGSTEGQRRRGLFGWLRR